MNDDGHVESSSPPLRARPDDQTCELKEHETLLGLSPSGNQAFCFGSRQPPKARVFTQILSVLAVSFGCFLHGTTVSFPAVFVPSLLKSNDSRGSNQSTDSSFFSGELPFYVYTDDEALIVSIASFGMLAGSLVAGPMANLIGRKWTCVFGTCLTLTLSYALIPLAQFLWMIHLARFLMGAGVGFSTTTSTLYIMEITTPSMRAGLAVIPAIAGTLGVLFIQVLGAFLNWRPLCLVLTGLNAPFLLLLLLMPESPVYLIATEQIERAHKVLRFLRGPRWDVTGELTDLKIATEGVGENKERVTLRDFLVASVLKPFVISLCLMFFFQFTGINLVLQYSVHIFQTAESEIDEFLATVFLGLALLVSNVLTLMVAGRMLRRLMLLLSAMGITVTLTLLGVYFYLKALEDNACQAEAVEDCPQPYTSSLGSLPLLLLMVYIFFFNLGYGAMIWITVAELLPMHVRSVTNSLSVSFTCLCSFLTSHTYKHLMDVIRMEGIFWLYGGISLTGFLFILAFVPETKGKNEQQIQEFFLSKRQRQAMKEKRARKRSSGEDGDDS